jgi:hypothetical protein
MQRETLISDLDAAVAVAAGMAAQDGKVEALAQKMVESEPELSARLGQFLVLTRYRQLITSQRAEIRRAANQQLFLPGFEHLPLRIPAKSGSRHPIREATAGELRSYIASLRKAGADRLKNSARLQEAEQLLKLLTKYSAKHKGITVAEAFEREAKKAAK